MHRSPEALRLEAAHGVVSGASRGAGGARPPVY